MILGNKIKLLSYVLFLAGWWTGCSTPEDPKPSDEDVPANNAEADAGLEAENNAGNSAANGALTANEDNAFENSNSANFAGEEGENSFNSPNSNAAQGTNENDLFANAMEAEGSNGKANESNQMANPTADPTAFAAESATPDPTMANADDPNNDAGRDGSLNMAALAAEASAAALPEENLASNLTPVGEGSNMVPPQLQENPSAVVPMAASPGPSASSVASNTPAPVEELDPNLSLISWVGYRINEENRQLKVEVLTEGGPEFEVYEESNRAQQLELVVRFYQSKLRRKIRWSIDSSEFRSPVAYVRLREFPNQGIVDVVFTHRDKVLPNFFAGQGKLLFVYTIPERYFDKSRPLSRRVKDQAESLLANETRPLLKANPALSAVRQVGYQQPDTLQKELKLARPIRDFMRGQAREKIDPRGLPQSFKRRDPNAVPQPRTGWHWSRFGLMAVAQDDLEPEEVSSNEEVANDAEGATEEAANEEEPNDSNEEIPENKQNNANNTQANESEASEGEAPENSEEAIPVETITEESDEDIEDPGSLTGVNAAGNENAANPANNAAAANAQAAPSTNQAAPENAQLPPENAVNESFGNTAPPAENFNAEQPAVEPAPSSPTPAPNELVGQANAGPAEPQYNGKPIFMEFYEAPLSLVLKSFSDETGNNFVYPSAIGQTPVTVHFKGVPWDEALKAILETHSLGLVRIGQNVVRVDQIANLTSYMQALEQAKQFETRRLPTKVLIFRLNNAVAKDILSRVALLLARDVELDPRIKLSDDERTNSLVMEAPAHVLAKAKNIIERLDLETPQVEISSRIVEVQKTNNNFLGFSWGNNLNFDPGRALGFGTLNFPNSLGSNFAVDPGVSGQAAAGVGRFRFGSLNKFVDLDLLLKLEETKGTTNVLQSNRVLVLDGQRAKVLAGNSKFFRPAGGGLTLPGEGAGAGAGAGTGLAEVKFNLSLEVTPQVTAMSSVIMDLKITSDTPAPAGGEALADKNTRELETQMVRASGDTGVIGGIYDTSRVTSMKGIPFLSDIPIIGALFRSSSVDDKQTELLIMVTPNIVSGQTKEAALADEQEAKTREANKQQALTPKSNKKRDAAIF